MLVLSPAHAGVSDFQFDRTVDFATRGEIVNASNKNKRVSFERPLFGRMNSPRGGRTREKCFSPEWRSKRPAGQGDRARARQADGRVRRRAAANPAAHPGPPRPPA